MRYMNSASRMHHVSRDLGRGCIIPGLSVGRKIKKSDKAHKDLAESPECAKNSPLGGPRLCVFLVQFGQYNTIVS